MAEERGEATTSGMKRAGYYDAHSEYQRRVVEAGAAAIRRMIGELDLDAVKGPLTIADYGAGTGATSVQAMGTAIEAVRVRSEDIPVLAIHNDLPTSDFGALRLAAEKGGYLGIGGGPIYSAAAAGSFFDQVLPDSVVRMGMCFNAAHWYRRPPDVGPIDGMYFSAAEGEQRERLASQAAGDWEAFLEARAAELVPGGRFLVQGIGTDDEGRASAAELLDQMWKVAVDLRDRGVLDREALDRFVFPVYCRTAAEAATPVEPGGALAGELTQVTSHMEEVPNPYWEELERSGDVEEYAGAYTAFVRAFAESTLDRELFAPGARGADPAAVRDQFFKDLERATAADPAAGRYRAYVLTAVFAHAPAER
jgi:cyclopropane-fatty-acyl-phospholipid synthase